MTTNPWFRSAVRDIDPAACMDLVRSRGVGRVGFLDGRGPTIFPVNYTVYGESILIRTSPYGTLAESAHYDWLAFQVDDIDEFTESGWSVLLRGPVERARPEELPMERGVQPEPWAEGARTLLLRLDPILVTGRRLLPS
jgi:nitroimidazol reductase NimA-like FMN-containing flavoprotein (pyridoxamine 5'-phosphate oxidase superfamily)